MADGGTVRDAIERHYSEVGIAADGGSSERWVVPKLGPVPVPFPNTRSRRKALALHDVNHVVSGVSSGNVGEAEISAWELGSGGCGTYVAAWALDLAGMLGFFLWPARVIRAFAAGRTMRNVYGLGTANIFGMDLDELREGLSRTDSNRPSPVVSVALFVGCLVVAIPVGLVFLTTVLLSLPVWVFTKDR